MWIFYYIDFKTAPEKRRFLWLESQNKPSLAEIWLIWYKIKSWKRNVTQADQKLSIHGRNSTFLSRQYPISAGLWQGSMCRLQLRQPRTQGLSIKSPGTGRKVLNSDWPIKNA